MAFTNDTVSTLTDLFIKLDTWMATVGWTAEHLDTSSTAGTGGEWAMRRTSGATNIRFAASWDGAGTVANVGLYQYVDQNYVIGSRPWGQANDSGNGLQASTPNADIIDERHVIIGNTPVQYWAFEDDDYTHVVVETALGVYAHFGWGLLDKHGGDWTGGEYCYGQRNNLTGITAGTATYDGMTFLLDGHFNDTADAGGPPTAGELMAATIHCESLPNQPGSGQWAVSMGGDIGSPQTTFGNDRQGSPIARVLFTWGLRAGPFANGPYRMDGTDLSGHTAIWPISLVYVDSNVDIYGYPLATMKDVGGINIKNRSGGESILIGGDTWVVFPANIRYPGSGSTSSGYLGIAYKQVT